MTTPESLPDTPTAPSGEEAGADTQLIAQLIRGFAAEWRTPVPSLPTPGSVPGPTPSAPPGLGGIYGVTASPHDVPVHPGTPAQPPATTVPLGVRENPAAWVTPSLSEPVASQPKPHPSTPRSDPQFYFLSEAERGFSLGDPGEALGHGVPSSAPSTVPFFDVETVRREFPALHQEIRGRRLIWLDNAATTHKPRSVIDATSAFYSRDNSNIHRAAHTLAARATELYEGGREKVRRFLGAADAREIVFVRGTTEAINLVAQTYGRKFIGRGDEIVLTTMEHHANIVPWQLLAEQTGAVIRVAPINDAGELILDAFAALLGPRTKLVSVTHVANALGTVNPVEQIVALAHAYGVPVLLDAAQSTPHLPVNVQALDVDFLAFSGHKIFGPTGIGALYGKSHWLEQLPPWQGGGNMIRDVTFARTTFQDYPQKFEAGTQDIAGVVGLGAAIDYLLALGLPAIAAYEHALLEYATAALADVPGLRPIGTAANKASVLSFVLDGFKPEQVGQHLDRHGIAVRSGHHCAQPAVRRFGLESTVRPSLAFYNTREEIDALVRALRLLRRH